jgi:hypothetical protein
MAKRWFCEECNWRGTETELLSANNPFDPEYVIVGCPKCKEINTMRAACDEPDRWKEATCGFPVEEPQRYRNTCYQHSIFNNK